MRNHIKDENVLWLFNEIISSFSTSVGIGLPLGNLTSQLLINVYMNEFDQFIKRKLKVRYYIRYADDFVIFNENKQVLIDLIPKLSELLNKELKLSLHPGKSYIQTFSSGVDFLGWINFPNHRILRTTTKKRMFKRLKTQRKRETTASYVGLLKHGNTYGLTRNILKVML